MKILLQLLDLVHRCVGIPDQGNVTVELFGVFKGQLNNVFHLLGHFSQYWSNARNEGNGKREHWRCVFHHITVFPDHGRGVFRVPCRWIQNSISELTVILEITRYFSQILIDHFDYFFQSDLPIHFYKSFQVVVSLHLENPQTQEYDGDQSKSDIDSVFHQGRLFDIFSDFLCFSFDFVIVDW